MGLDHLSDQGGKVYTYIDKAFSTQNVIYLDVSQREKSFSAELKLLFSPKCSL